MTVEGIERIRPPRWRDFATLFLAVFIVMGSVLAWLVYNTGRPDFMAGVGALAGLSGGVRVARTYTEVSGSGIEVCRFLRRKRFDWAEIDDIQRQGAALGARCVEISCAGGHRTRLPAPIDWLPFKDDRFDQSYEKIKNVWRQNRGQA